MLLKVLNSLRRKQLFLERKLQIEERTAANALHITLKKYVIHLELKNYVSE